MVVVYTPIHAEFGSYNHREDASLFIREKKYPIENFPRDVETLKTENITLKSQPSQMNIPSYPPPVPPELQPPPGPPPFMSQNVYCYGNIFLLRSLIF